MPRLIKTKKKRPPGGEQADSKSSCAASPSSSHLAIVSSLKPSIILHAISDGFSMITATGTNLQSVMDAIARNGRGIVPSSRRRGVAGRRQGKHVAAHFGSIRCKFRRRTMKSIAPSPWRAVIDREAEVAPQKSRPDRSM